MTTITPDHRHQAANWRWLVVVLAIALFGTFAKDGVSQYLEHNDRQHVEAVTNCRSRYAAAVSSAQVDNDIAFDNLVIAITDPAARPYDAQIKRIGDTGRALTAARDARNAFEEHPSGSCDDPPPTGSG